MSPSEPIQERMYRDMSGRDLFAQAHEQAMGQPHASPALSPKPAPDLTQPRLCQRDAAEDGT